MAEALAPTEGSDHRRVQGEWLAGRGQILWLEIGAGRLRVLSNPGHPFIRHHSARSGSGNLAGAGRIGTSVVFRTDYRNEMG